MHIPKLIGFGLCFTLLASCAVPASSKLTEKPPEPLDEGKNVESQTEAKAKLVHFSDEFDFDYQLPDLPVEGMDFDKFLFRIQETIQQLKRAGFIVKGLTLHYAGDRGRLSHSKFKQPLAVSQFTDQPFKVALHNHRGKLTDSLDYQQKKLLRNEWEVQIFQVAQISVALRADTIVRAPVQIRVQDFTRESQAYLRYQLSVSLPKDYLVQRYDDLTFSEQLSTQTANIFKDLDLSSIKSPQARLNLPNKKLSISYVHHDPKYQAEELQSLQAELRPILTLLQSREKLEAVTLQYSTFVGSENWEDPAQLEDPQESNQAQIDYVLNGKPNKRTIGPQPLAILDQELLKLRQLRRALELPTSYRIDLQIVNDESLFDKKTLITFHLK